MRGSFFEAFPPAYLCARSGRKTPRRYNAVSLGGCFRARTLECAPDTPVELVCTAAGVVREFWPVEVHTGAAHRTIHGFGSQPTPAAAGLLAADAKRGRPAQPSFGRDLCRVMDRFRRGRRLVRGPHNFVPDCAAL